MSNSCVYILTVCDCDPDRLLYGGTDYYNQNSLIWNGVAKGIPSVFDFMSDSLDSKGETLKITWCVRCDEQLRQTYGVHRWAYNEFSDIWEYLKNDGHEIAWHPHFWRWSDKEAVWFQEKNPSWIADCLKNAYSDIPSNMKPRTLKTGWGYHCNESVGTADELGLRADVSPVPSLKSTSTIVGTGLALGTNDWSISPKQPYYPSKEDYRVNGIDNYSLLFIPATLFRLPFHYSIGKRIVYKIQAARGQRQKIPTHTNYAPLSPTKPTKAMKKTIRNIFKSASDKEEKLIIHSYFHPDELLRESGTFSRENFIKYFELLGNTARENNTEFFYVTANELACL
jgi:hypothetical protein